MATIDQNLQRIQNVHTDMANSVTNKFGYTFSSGNGFEQIADKLGVISTDINTQLASLLGNFTATISVTTVAGAAVTATLGQSTITATANNQGVATINVDMRGTYSIQSTVSNGSGEVAGVSSTSQVEITTKNETQSTTVSFATLTINIPSGSTYQLTDNTTTYSGTSSGIDITYYLPNLGTWSVSCTNGTESASDSVAVSDYTSYSKTLSYVHVYGVIWDKSSSTILTRTDDSANFANPDPFINDGVTIAESTHPGSSPFDNLYPWSGIVKETINKVWGSEQYPCEMVKIPKFWYKITNESSSISFQIADGPIDGFSVSPAHQVRYDGDIEKDYVYIGRYKTSEKSLSGSSLSLSKSGQQPARNMSIGSFRTDSRNGSNSPYLFYQQDYAMFITIRLLYIVEFANFDSQSCIGYGCGDSSVWTGQTDSMQYHTGTMKSSRETYGNGVQYRWIEDLWSEVYEFVDGVYFNSRSMYLIFDPRNFSSSSGGSYIGSCASSTGIITELSSGSPYDWALFPKSTDNSASYKTYVSDKYINASGSSYVLYTGGCYQYNDLSYGLFYFDVSSYYSGYSSYIGSRIMCLPSSN